MAPTGRYVVSPHPHPNDLLTLYLLQIRTTPLLSADDEQRLGRVIERGRRAAEALADGLSSSPAEERDLGAAVAEARTASEQFVRSNLALVVSIAKRYRASGVPFLDLIQDGNMGLLRAVEKFDHSRGVRFSTYGTWWIRQAIEAGIARGAGVIHLPDRMHRWRARLFATQARLEVELGRTPTATEVARELGITAAELAGSLAVSSRPLSMTAASSEGDVDLGSLIADPSAPSPEEEAARALLPIEVGRLLSVLDERERKILQLRFGLDRGRPRTLLEVARIVEVTPERVRQIEARALEKLRRASGLPGSS